MAARLVRCIKLPSDIKMCRAAISPHHRIPSISQIVLKDPSSIRRFAVQRKYEYLKDYNLDRTRLGLWLIIWSNDVQRQRTIRSWAKRRVLKAINEELNAHGFDAQGRKISKPHVPSEMACQERHDDFEGLIGMAEIFVAPQGAESTFEEVRKQARLLVHKIMEICGWPRQDDNVTARVNSNERIRNPTRKFQR